MKKYLALLLLLTIIFSLVGCSNKNSPDSIEARRICNFKKIYADVDVGIRDADDIFVDLTTGVIYFRTYGDRLSGFTPLYNADGSLKIWKGDYYAESSNISD